MEQYLYADEYDDNEIKILTVGQLLEFFNKSDDKKNGSSLDDYIKDNISMEYSKKLHKSIASLYYTYGKYYSINIPNAIKGDNPKWKKQ